METIMADVKVKFVKVTPEYEHLEELFDIRDEAFPENERSTTRNLETSSENSKLIIYGIEDNNQLIGFTYMYYIDDDFVYLLYLAIGQAYRDKHYGSIVLRTIIDDLLKDKILFGCIEALIPEAQNYEQRVKRAQFYTRNSMYILDEILHKDPIGDFQFCCSDKSVTSETLKLKMASLKQGRG